MSQFTLITGGARSGKSQFAELLAASTKRPVIYIATAQVWDDEMARRVRKHQEQRPSTWRLIEEPQNIRETLLQLKDEDGVILLDCVTLWLSNLLLQGQTKPTSTSELNQVKFSDLEPQIAAEVDEVARLAREIKPQVIFVTNEIGQGIVPEYPLSRAYRDVVGRCNRILAQSANEVYLVVAGFPMEIKHTGEQLLSSLREE
ncbi:MAG: bifunctional adenosylcobinamide kinase/adenosylcobinamide-phosphate guanylyltransferase [Bacillota bacterium]|nr:bifunctional adenosylcobinamide kinase/adenosylcobinamide-phosphate guanylyltransferase [Bacillota bacterium]MDP4158314.1 bifunctional adenosylcobinamide kinase/adenosylcobinamide-phosphate guanylyltransferase [Bacillota bacterium]